MRVHDEKENLLGDFIILNQNYFIIIIWAYKGREKKSLRNAVFFLIKGFIRLWWDFIFQYFKSLF